MVGFGRPLLPLSRSLCPIRESIVSWRPQPFTDRPTGSAEHTDIEGRGAARGARGGFITSGGHGERETRRQLSLSLSFPSFLADCLSLAAPERESRFYRCCCCCIEWRVVSTHQSFSPPPLSLRLVWYIDGPTSSTIGHFYTTSRTCHSVRSSSSSISLSFTTVCLNSFGSSGQPMCVCLC